MLTLAPNGVDALDALGVLDRVRADAVPSRRNAMYGAEQWHFVFGRRAFFGAHPTPAGDVLWFVNVPGPLLSRDEGRARSLELAGRSRG